MSAYVLVCDETNFDAQSGSCSAPYYAPQPSLIPPLSIADGITISMAILAVWAIGFGVRCIRRSLIL